MIFTRQSLVIIILIFYVLSAFSQSSDGNLYIFKDGDRTIRKEIEYVHPGQDGENRLWDFGSLSTEGKEYVEEYKVTKDSATIVKISSGHRSYYRVKADTIFCTGFSDPNTNMIYLRPEIFQLLPSSYGDSTVMLLYGEGKYSETLNICTYGKTSYKIDSYGILILPDDTIKYNSFRTRHHTRVGQKISPHTSILSNGCASSYSDDSICYKLDNDSIIWCIDRYNWFVPGYRFPAIETINTYILSNGTKIAHDNVSYYYPLEEQENYCINRSNETDTLNQVSQRRDGQTQIENKMLQNEIVYNCHFNEDNNLIVEIITQYGGEITAVLTNVAGVLIGEQKLIVPQNGDVRICFNTSKQVQGVYLLTLYSVDRVICDKIYFKGINYE